uniref:MADF domain-containing protein n=1 Tax=Timema tahoe TaxID=61484 RepID=A0A7R9NV32_9NEOP|nr:unnamed protein product [Timema tahoe]
MTSSGKTYCLWSRERGGGKPTANQRARGRGHLTKPIQSASGSKVKGISLSVPYRVARRPVFQPPQDTSRQHPEWDAKSPAISSKWVRLRERYAREKRREFIENSSGETPVKKKEWYLLKDMEFLSPHVKRRKCFFIVPTNTSDNIEESNSANELEDSQPPAPSLPPPSLPPPSLPPPSPSSSTRSHLNILIRHPFRGGSFYVSMK